MTTFIKEFDKDKSNMILELNLTKEYLTNIVSLSILVIITYIIYRKYKTKIQNETPPSESEGDTERSEAK